MISSCSLVGAHCWASVLRQMRHSFEMVYGDPDAAETQLRFKEAVRLAATVRGLRSVRLGIVGGQAPGYFAMGADPFSVHHGLGAQIQTFSLIDFSNAATEVNDKDIAADVARFKALGVPHKDTTDDDLPTASRLYLAMRSLIAEPLFTSVGRRVRLRISQGMHSGTFHAFVLDGNHRELMITGSGTTETVECESEAEAGQILCSAGTAALLEPRRLGRASGDQDSAG